MHNWSSIAGILTLYAFVILLCLLGKWCTAQYNGCRAGTTDNFSHSFWRPMLSHHCVLPYLLLNQIFWDTLEDKVARVSEIVLLSQHECRLNKHKLDWSHFLYLRRQLTSFEKTSFQSRSMKIDALEFKYIFWFKHFDDSIAMCIQVMSRMPNINREPWSDKTP